MGRNLREIEEGTKPTAVTPGGGTLFGEQGRSPETGYVRPHTMALSTREGAGRLFLTEGQGLFIGRVTRTDHHSHDAVQICFGLEGKFSLRSDPADAWRTYDAASIASGHPHELDGNRSVMALLYLDPETAGSRSFARVSHETGICPVPNVVLRSVLPLLVHAWEKEDTAERIPALCHRLGRVLAPGASPWGVFDARVRRAVNMMRAAPGKRAGLVELSTAISVSPTRLAHIFREQTGLPIRRYSLWLRLGDAVERIAHGASLSEAAHSAGFSDPAHLTRTLRRMFGIVPSALKSGARSAVA